MDQTALFEFDSSQTAFINASDEIDVEIQASKAIVSYWQEDLDRILSHSNLRLLFDFPTECFSLRMCFNCRRNDRSFSCVGSKGSFDLWPLLQS